MFSKCLLLNEIELENHENSSITLFNHSDKDQEIIAQVIAELFDEKSVKEVFNNNENISFLNVLWNQSFSINLVCLCIQINNYIL